MRSSGSLVRLLLVPLAACSAGTEPDADPDSDTDDTVVDTDTVPDTDDSDPEEETDVDTDDTDTTPPRLGFDVASLTVEAGESVNLSVSWSGRPPRDPSLAWFTNCGQVMGLNQRGSYVAPDAATSCTVTAASVAEPAAVATLPVSVTAPVGGGATRWTRHLASDHDDSVRRLAATADGGLVALVETWGDFGGPGLGDLDVVVVRLDAAGTVLWTHRLATTTREFAGDVAIASDGTIWVVGTTYGELDGTSAGESDVFVAAVDDDGDRVSLHQFGTDGSDNGTAVTVSPAGEVVVAGWTVGALDGASAGGADGFVRRYDAEGEVAWTRQFGGAGIDFVIGVALDGDEVVAVGTTDGLVGAQSAGGMDGYVTRIAGDGSSVDHVQYGAATDDRSYGIAARPGGGVVVIGALGGDAFVDAFDAGGGLDWSYTLATAAEELGQAVAVDPDGSVVAFGSTTGDLGTPNVGFFDAFLVRLDPAGTPVWTRRIGTAADDYGWAVARLANGDFAFGGRTDGLLADDAGLGGDGYLRRVGP